MKKYNDLVELKTALRSHVDIVGLISKYTGEVKKQGQRFLTLCPFHHDTNPSFTISPYQKYKDGTLGCWGCFSCFVAGDLFAFIEKIHNVNFIEAIEIIAELTNFDLTKYQRELSSEEQEKENGYNILGQVSDMFHQQLLNTPQELKFFLERGINETTLNDFCIGYCPSMQFAQNYCSGEVLHFIEPTLSNHSRIFGGRLLYPQRTISDRIFGFFARQPDTREANVPKYIGTSSQGKLFESSGRLFAFAKARNRLRNIDLPLVIVEGFHDVMMCQQYGIPAVGLCGTKISKEQIEVLQQHSIRKVIICLDNDNGGQEGMFEFARKCPEFTDISCTFLITESEPEDSIRKHGHERFINDLRDSTIPPLDYILWYKTRFTNINLEIPSAKLRLLDDIKPFLLAYPIKSINRELGIASLSGITKLAKESIEDYITETGDQSLVNIQAEMIILAELALNSKAWITLSKTSERDFSLNRYTIAITIQIKDTLSPIQETLSTIVQDITGTLEVKNEKRICSSAVAIRRTIEEMERRTGTENGLAGLSLGPAWAWMNSMLGGLQGGRCYLIGAFLGVGKSVVGMNWVHALSIADFPGAAHAGGLLVSMEMTPTENNFRLLAIDSGMPESFIKASRYETQEQIDFVINSAEKINKSRITWMSEQNTVKEIAMQARILQSQGNLDYILIDYIQLLDLSPYHNRGKFGKHEEYAEASQDIKNLADSLNVPIIILAQLNRESQKEDLPAVEHLASSIKFAQDAHAVFLLTQRSDGMLGILGKNRGGGKGTIRLSFDSNPQTSNLQIKEFEILKGR